RHVSVLFDSIWPVSKTFVLIGFFRMLAEAGAEFTGLLSLEQQDFVRFTLDLLDDTLRPRWGLLNMKQVNRFPPPNSFA
ncbi:MAG: hypothetical protein ACM3ZC_16215, partial [Bacteroidota bacterium]